MLGISFSGCSVAPMYVLSPSVLLTVASVLLRGMCVGGGGGYFYTYMQQKSRRASH